MSAANITASSKTGARVDFRVVFAFPDIYDLGMSNLGWMILYDVINGQPDMFADRVFSPWTDMEEVMRREGIPLYGLESKYPGAGFWICWPSACLTSSCTPNYAQHAEPGRMPVRSLDRDARYPLVIAGGARDL